MDTHKKMDLGEFRRAKIYTKLQLLSYSLSLSKNQGWFLEFGVYEGASINYMSGLYPDKVFYGFDSFEGLPEAWNRSKDSVYPKGHFALPKTPKINSNVKLVKGFFDTSLPKWLEHNANTDSTVSFLHIDSDLYSSAKTILSELDCYIKTGAIIVFDELCDWKRSGIYSLWEEGEWLALSEWEREYKMVGRTDKFGGAIVVC